MHVKLSKRILLSALGAVVAAIGFTGTASPAHADSLKTLQKYKYVKTTRAMFTGQYHWVNGKRGSKIITPKGTILRLDGSDEVSTKLRKSHPVIYLNRGDLHYNAEKNIDDVRVATPFKASDFKGYNLKMKVRTRLLQSGTGYDKAGTNRYKPIFHVTLDGYLEYYSAARLKHYRIDNNYDMGKLYNMPAGGNTDYTPSYLNRIKPTASRKITTFKIKGNTTYLYYTKPVYGLTEKKVSKRYYRLTITKIGDTQNHIWRTGEDITDASWNRYHVGGHNFYDTLSVENGD